MTSILFRPTFTLATLLLVVVFAASQSNAQKTEPEPKLKALIIDGQNNHPVWPKSTVMMKQYLEETGLFEVSVARTKFTWRSKREKDYLPFAGVAVGEELPKPKTDPDFAPAFKDYDVVISNFGNAAADWPEATRTAFELYVAHGGGFVTVHAADNSFGDWLEYNKIIGLGGWGGRTTKTGTYLYYDKEGKLIRDDGPGKVGAHGAQHNISIVVRAEHPITAGLPENWLSAKDECYSFLRGPAENITVLATGQNNTRKSSAGRHEPLLMVLRYAQGRIFHTTLGHDSYSFEGVGFITTFTRGCQWAATGAVTLPVPEDFPTHDKPSSRTFSRAIEGSEDGAERERSEKAGDNGSQKKD